MDIFDPLDVNWFLCPDVMFDNYKNCKCTCRDFGLN